MSKRDRRVLGAWIAALAPLLLIAAWWLRVGAGAPEVLPVRTQPAPDRPEPPSLAGATELAQRRAPAGEPLAEPAQEPASAEAAPEPQPEPEAADLEARDWLSLRVVDERQNPILDAAVTIRGLRKEGEEGSWYGRRDQPAPLRTGSDGRVRLPYERWVDIDGKTVQVDLAVTHPDFVPFSDYAFALAPGESTIVLQQGSMVRVCAWFGSRDQVVTHVAIELEWEARLGEEAWHVEPDGCRWTTRLAEGPHWITLTHRSPELGELASDFTPFELDEHGTVDLSLELKPLLSLRGKLDEAVPRPVVGGHVKVNLHASEGGVGLDTSHEAPVAADGTFELRGLRQASGQVIALCEGWVSKRVPPRTLAESRWSVSPDATPAQVAAALERARAEERIAQPVDVQPGVELLVEMELAGGLEVRVVDETGAPLAGVRVSAWPNVLWHGVGSQIFPWGDWSAETDGQGVARIVDLPPDGSLWLGAEAATHRMRKAERDDTPHVEIVSGEVARFELVLEETQR